MGTGMIWIIFIGIAAVSWLVQMNLQNKFKKYSKIPTGNGMTGADVALKMLHDNGIYDEIQVIPSEIPQTLTLPNRIPAVITNASVNTVWAIPPPTNKE